jgi:hypothetical protein
MGTTFWLKGKDKSEDIGIYGRTTLKFVLGNRLGAGELDSSG